MSNKIQTQRLSVIDDEINNFKERLEQVKFELSGTIPKISAKSFSRAYTAIYELSTDKNHFEENNELLYKKFTGEIHLYLAKRVLPSIDSNLLSNAEFLFELQKRWENHCLMIKWMSRLFQYIERYFIQRGKQFPRLEPMGINIFRMVIIKQICNRIWEVYLEELKNSRIMEPDIQNCESMKKCAEIFAVLANHGDNKYIDDLKRNLTGNSGKFYQEIYQKWSLTLECKEYIQKVEILLQKEMKLLENILPENEFKKSILEEILSKFDNMLIKSYKDFLLSRESEPSKFIQLVKKRDLTILKTFYLIFSRLKDNFEGIHEQFRELIFVNAKVIIDARQANKQNSKKKKINFEFIESLIKFYEGYEEIVVKSFNKNNYFDRAFREAMESVFNTATIPPIADLLVEFTDLLLRKKGLSKKNFNIEAKRTLLEGAFKIFSCLSDKDRFLNFYGVTMVRRLINDSLESLNEEKFAQEQIKLICGTTYTKKLEDKLKAIQVANSNKNDFVTYAKKYLPLLSPEMIHINVIENINWLDSHVEMQIKLPEEILTLQSCYMKYFSGTNLTKPKKLEWIHSVSTIVTSTKFTGREIEISLGVYQYMILNLFQKTDQLSFKDILEGTQLDEQTLSKNLAPMMFCKQNKAIFCRAITTTSTKQDKFNNEDQIQLNMNFNPKIPHHQVAVPSDQEVFLANDKDIEKKRHTILGCAIMKIIKDKPLNFDSIAEKVKKYVTLFTPTEEMIQIAIDELISKDFCLELKGSPVTYQFK